LSITTEADYTLLFSFLQRISPQANMFTSNIVVLRLGPDEAGPVPRPPPTPLSAAPGSLSRPLHVPALITALEQLEVARKTEEEQGMVWN